MVDKQYRRIGTVLVACLLLLAIAGCGASHPITTEDKPQTINITYVKAPLNIPSILEKQQRLFDAEFEKDGIKIGLPEITVGPKQTEALAAGSVDFAHCLGGASALLAAANGVDLRIVGIYSRAPKAFVILAKQDNITTVADLKGKKVAGPKGTVLHQLLLAALTKAGVQAGEVEFLAMDIPASVAAMMNGSVDAALAAGPDVLKAQQAGARVITTGEGLVEATLVTAVRGEFLRKYPGLVARFVRVHRSSVDRIKQDPEAALKVTATETGLTMEMVKAMAPWYDFDFSIRMADVQELKRTQEFLLQNGMLTKTVDIDGLMVNIE